MKKTVGEAIVPAELRLLNPQLGWHQAQTYSTNTGIVLRGREALIVDPGISQGDFERLAAFLADYDLQAGLVTHAHWDHFLWDARLGSEVPRYATRATLAGMQANRERQEAQMRELEELNFEGREYWQRELLYRELPLDEGRQQLAGFELEVLRLDGHCEGSAAFLFPEAKAVFVGDHLSDLELPSLDDAPRALEAYLKTLDALEELTGRAECIIPGHGSPCGPSEARRRLDADRRYLQALHTLEPAELNGDLTELATRFLRNHPDARAGDAWSQELHRENLKVLAQKQP